VQFLSLQPKNKYTSKIQLLGIPDEFVEHGTVLELQQYYNIDVKSLEIVFQLIENNYASKISSAYNEITVFVPPIFHIAIICKYVSQKIITSIDSPKKSR
jgi:hypothetical protein